MRRLLFLHFLIDSSIPGIALFLLLLFLHSCPVMCCNLSVSDCCEKRKQTYCLEKERSTYISSCKVIPLLICSLFCGVGGVPHT